MKTFLKTRLGIFSTAAAGVIVVVGIWLVVRPAGPSVDVVEAKLGSITQTVSVTGKVKATQTVDLAFEKGGRVIKVNAETGTKVKTGDVIVQLDTTDAESALRVAQTNLESATLALTKLRGSSGGNSADQLNKSYISGFGTLNDIYTDTSAILDSLNTSLFTSTIDISPNRKSNIQLFADIAGGSNSNFINLPTQIKFSYDSALVLYNKAFADYKAIKGSTDGPAIVTALNSAYAAETAILNIINTASGVARNVTDIAKQKNANLYNADLITQIQTDLTTNGTSISGHIANISNASQAIANYGLDVRSGEITVEQKQNALSDAQANLLKYSIRAPFAGVITREDAKVGEIISPNVSLVSLISQSALQIEANVLEADIAKIKVGNKTKVTLDAFNSSASNAAFTATVSAIDPAEIIIDGVPTYKTIFQFENPDAGIKPGMTANLDITTAFHENVLIIEQRVVVRQGERQFVQLPGADASAAVIERDVTAGLRGSDGMIEILNGLNPGDKVIARPTTITPK